MLLGGMTKEEQAALMQRMRKEAAEKYARLMSQVPKDDDDEDIPGRMVFTYNASQMMSQMIRIRQGLNFYGRLLKVYRAIGEGNAY